MEVEIATGPSLAASLMAGDINISYMGNGVSYNYFTEGSNIKLIALDNLTDDDRLIARNVEGYKGYGLSIDSTIEEIGEALKGATVGLDTTATPITFLASFISVYNGLSTTTADDYLWYTDESGNQLPSGLSNYPAANEITTMHIANANVASGAESATWDFAVAYAPVSTALENHSSGMFTTVCMTSTHLADHWVYTPSNWAVNVDWLEANEDVFKRFMIALVQGMTFRKYYAEVTCEDIEYVTAGSVLAEDLDVNICEWLDYDDQLELYNSGEMVELAQNIRDNHVELGNIEDATAKSVAEAADFSYMAEACEYVKQYA